MAESKAGTVHGYLKDHPDAKLADIMKACNVSKPVAIEHRRSFRAGLEDAEAAATPEAEEAGKGEGGALQEAYPPAANPPPPKPKEDEVEAAKPPRVYRFRLW